MKTKELRIDEHVAKAVASIPPLSLSQIEQLRKLFGIGQPPSYAEQQRAQRMDAYKAAHAEVNRDEWAGALEAAGFYRGDHSAGKDPHPLLSTAVFIDHIWDGSVDFSPQETADACEITTEELANRITELASLGFLRKLPNHPYAWVRRMPYSFSEIAEAAASHLTEDLDKNLEDIRDA